MNSKLIESVASLCRLVKMKSSAKDEKLDCIISAAIPLVLGWSIFKGLAVLQNLKLESRNATDLMLVRRCFLGLGLNGPILKRLILSTNPSLARSP